MHKTFLTVEEKYELLNSKITDVISFNRINKKVNNTTSKIFGVPYNDVDNLIPSDDANIPIPMLLQINLDHQKTYHRYETNKYHHN